MVPNLTKKLVTFTANLDRWKAFVADKYRIVTELLSILSNNTLPVCKLCHNLCYWF